MFLKKRKYPRICMFCTVYSLFEYLLYSSADEIKSTYFIIEGWLWKDFGDKFEHSFHMPERGFGKKWRNVSWLYWSIIKWFKLPSFKGTELYTLDHLPHYAVFIGRHKFTLLEDGPYCHKIMYNDNVPYSIYEERDLENLPFGKEKIAFLMRKIVYGPVYFNRWGKNKQCTDMILSTDDYLDYFENKTIHRINFKGIWNTFTDKKQDIILKAFNMNHEDVDLLSSRKIIILTQPLSPDYISEEEHGEIWKKIISNYPLNEIIVKPHPRDTYNYENDFKGLVVFRKTLPAQFFEVLNLVFEKAVTTFSSSVFGLNAEEIDWYGTEVSETINKRIGSSPFIPEGLKVNHCKI